MAILTTVACNKDSNDDPIQVKVLGWAIGGSSYPSQYGTILHTADGGSTWAVQSDSTVFPGAGLSDLLCCKTSITTKNSNFFSFFFHLPPVNSIQGSVKAGAKRSLYSLDGFLY